ncbi:MAG: CRISPR system precrRNA processing endoribonuclease RAMP protein Cas6 [Acidobacteria bacterium]|nr:CRISPR system precrRNA processing endoribonuclease RAMP protein Cas6 [Acidobacteriota bacterium]
MKRLVFTLRACEPACLPGFLGSTLRGAFGHALKKRTCLKVPPVCNDICQFEDGCIYHQIFEAGHPRPHPGTGQLDDFQHPYLIVLPPISLAQNRQQLQRDETLTFEITLIGKSTDVHAPVTEAVRLMGAFGLGVARSVFELESVASPDEPVTTLGNLVAHRLTELPQPDQITIQLETPARIRLGKKLQFQLPCSILVRSLARRINSLAAFHGSEPLNLDIEELTRLASKVKTVATQIRWCDWERYSNRQETKMKLGGVIGKITYSGPALAGLLPLLAAGEIVHVGAATTFGLGGYRLSVSPHLNS